LGERLMLLDGVQLLDEPSGPPGEATLDERLRELTPPWLPRIDSGAAPRQERPGAAVAEVLGWLCDALGFARVPRICVIALFDHPLGRLPARVQVPLLHRLARRPDGGLFARYLMELLCIEVE